MGQQRRDSTFSVGTMEGDPCPSSTSMKGRWSLVSTAAYLCLNNDPQLQAVLQHQLTLSGCGKGKSVLRTANEVMTSLKLDIVISEAGVERQTGEHVLPKYLTRLLAEAQVAVLDNTLCGKTIQGIFFKQTKQEGWDTSGSHAWFLDGRLRGETEGLIVTAQDGVMGWSIPGPTGTE